MRARACVRTGMSLTWCGTIRRTLLRQPGVCLLGGVDDCGISCCWSASFSGWRIWGHQGHAEEEALLHATSLPALEPEPATGD